MAFERRHSATADATFSATGSTNWNANQTPSGADVGGIPYCPTATTETTSSKFTFDGATLTLAMGTVTTAPGAISLTQTRNASGTTFNAIIKAVITDTASASGSLAMQILGGAAGTTTLVSVDKSGNGIIGNSIRIGNISTGSGASIGYFAAGIQFGSGCVVSFTSGNADGTVDSALSRTAAGEIAFGTGAAGSAAGTCRAAAYKVGATAGASFGPGAVTSITVVNGIVTAIS